MKYTPSINIAQTIFDPNSYIVTQNAIKVIGNIVNSFNAGVHSFKVSSINSIYPLVSDSRTL